MNDKEFIELLNLYLDHEITAADAARLEAEVQSNPRRRQVYRQYCQMQKACKVLAADFQTETTPVADKKVVAFDASAGSSYSRGLYIFGAVAAAAACVALVFVSRGGLKSGPAAGAAISPVAAQSTQVSPMARMVTDVSPAAAKTVPASSGGLVQRPMLVNDPLLLADRANDVEFARVNQPSEQLAWIGALQIAPVPQRVPIETLRFEAQPTILPQDNRGLPNRSGPGEPAAEMTAFRFVK